ncbi:MAG: dihydroorotase [Chitinophagaceae bacterium]|nr:dihydroorotase [Chitinophagaceae bacterium]
MQVHILQAKITDTTSEFHNKVVDITIKDGIISKIAASAKKTGESSIEVDGKKVYTSAKSEGPISVSKGWVDIMADYAEPGHEQKETIQSGLAAAAAGGFTDVFLAPNTDPVVSTKSVVEFLLKKAAGNIVNLHPMGSISQNIEGKNLAEMMDMQAHGAIAFTDGWKPVQTSNLMLKALEYVKAFNGTLIQIPQDDSIASTGLMHEGAVSTRIGMAGIPPEAETIIIYRDLQLLKYTGSRLHFTGISTAAGLDMIRKAKKEKLNVTCSVTPYHLALTDEALAGYSSMYKVTPPLRTEKDRQALIKGLKDGTIDCITSHHRPQDWDAKVKEFEYAAYGMNIQEIAFNIALEGVGDKAELESIVDAFANKPREIFGLAQDGLQKGKPANMTLFSAKGKVVLNKMTSASANNPFIGKELPGKVIGVVNNNNIKLNQ